jgi:hypothetical protein
VKLRQATAGITLGEVAVRAVAGPEAGAGGNGVAKAPRRLRAGGGPQAATLPNGQNARPTREETHTDITHFGRRPKIMMVRLFARGAIRSAGENRAPLVERQPEFARAS